MDELEYVPDPIYTQNFLFCSDGTCQPMTVSRLSGITDVQCMLVKLFARKAAWLKIVAQSSLVKVYGRARVRVSESRDLNDVR